MKLKAFIHKTVVIFFAFIVIFPSIQPPACGVALRNIRVGVAVAPGFKKIPNWRLEFTRRLAYVSKIFEDEFHIRFMVTKWYDWNISKENEDLSVLIEDLRSRYPLGKVDIIIGLTHVQSDPRRPIQDPHTIGLARPLSGYLVLRYPMNKLYKVQEESVLAHELGHLFGAIHVDNSSSIMNPIIETQIPVRFDRENHEIITQTSQMNFRNGVESLPRIVIQRLLGSYLKMALSDQPFDFYYMMGVLYLNLGEMDNAVKCWKKAASISPDYPRIYFDLGMLYRRMGKNQEALKALVKAVQEFRFPGQNSDKVTALKTMGDIAMEDHNYASAYNAYSRALTVDSKNKEIKADLAIVRLRSGQVAEAIRDLEALYYQDPKNSRVMVNLGIAYYEAKRYAEGKRFLEQALKIRASSSEIITAHNYLGRIYYQTDKPEQAVDHFRIACASQPDADCFKGLAQIHYQLKQWDECIQASAKALQIQKDAADIYGLLGSAMTQKGKNEQAISILREGLRYASDSETASKLYKNIGYILLQMQQPTLAEKEFQMAVAKDWNNPECHLGLALTYLGMNNPVGARKELEVVLRLDPNNQKAKQMLSDVEKLLKQSPQMSIHIQGSAGGTADLQITGGGRNS